MSDEEEDDEGDLFVDSEKEGDDIEDFEENAKSVSVVVPRWGLRSGVYALLLNSAICICGHLILRQICNCVCSQK